MMVDIILLPPQKRTGFLPTFARRATARPDGLPGVRRDASMWGESDSSAGSGVRSVR